MKLHYMGKYNLDPASLPHGAHPPGAVKFREPENSRSLAVIANLGAAVLFRVTFSALYLRGGLAAFSIVGVLLSLAALLPHELLHAVCFREDVYLYTNLRQGMLFVVGPEPMRKGRFLFMSMLPNLVFGFVPFALFLIEPSWSVLGTLGALSIPMGFGDYINVFNAATQMPRGARTYLYEFHSYWYLP